MTLREPAGRLAAGCLAAVLALSLTACGSSNGSSAGQSSASHGARCAEVKASVKDLKAQLLGLRAGIVSRNDALAAARSLGSTVTVQAGSAGGEVSSDLDTLGATITNLITTVSDPTAKKHRVGKAEAKLLKAAHAFHVACKH